MVVSKVAWRVEWRVVSLENLLADQKVETMVGWKGVDLVEVLVE